jgi:transcriptional regulator with XRE-family HTH domain
MLHAAQIRAARALLGWRQEDLAQASGIGLATIARLEQGEGLVRSTVTTVVKIQRALEAAGVMFIAEDGTAGAGVRLKAAAR